MYEDDAEAESVWIDAAGLSPDRIVRRGRLDGEGQLANYWHTHAAGPGGPCSEIFVDRGAKYGPDGGPDVDEERFMEIWNLVFIQDQVDADLEIVGELPAKNIDTGSSLERVATLLQGNDNYFETDLFAPLFEVAESLVRQAPRHDAHDDVSLKIITEHGSCHELPDRRRRAAVERGARLHPATDAPPRGDALPPARHRGTGLGAADPPHGRAVGDVYPELRENESFVLQVATSEEDRFAATLRQGLQLFEKAVEQNAERKVLPGDEAFKLSDTFGFPLQLTEELAAEAGLSVDVERFTELLEEQRARARGARRSTCRSGVEAGAVPPTEFVGYQHLDAEGQIVAMLDAESRELPVAEEGEDVRVFLNVTPFYAEGGGQIGDHGIDPHGDRPDPRGRRAVGRPERDHARRARGVRRGPPRAGGARAGRSAAARGHGARPHVHPHRPLDAQAPVGGARSSGGLARGPRPTALRLPAPVRGPARGPGGS